MSIEKQIPEAEWGTGTTRVYVRTTPPRIENVELLSDKTRVEYDSPDGTHFVFIRGSE